MIRRITEGEINVRELPDENTERVRNVGQTFKKYLAELSYQ